MPTTLIKDGFRFFFYSSEGNEPAHIHVSKGNATGKIWLEPKLQVVYFHNFTNNEERKIIEIAEANFIFFKNKWNEYFNK